MIDVGFMGSEDGWYGVAGRPCSNLLALTWRSRLLITGLKRGYNSTYMPTIAELTPLRGLLSGP